MVYLFSPDNLMVNLLLTIENIVMRESCSLPKLLVLTQHNAEIFVVEKTDLNSD